MQALRAILIGVVRGWPMVLVSGLSSVLLLGGFVLWLRIPDAKTWQIAFSAVAGFVLLFCALWVMAATVAYFRKLHSEGIRCLGRAFTGTWKRVPLLLLWVCAAMLLMRWVGGFADSTKSWADYFRSETPLWLRGGFSAHQLDVTLGCGLFLLEWVIVPGLLLPWGVSLVTRGVSVLWNGAAAEWRQAVSRWGYWLALLAGALLFTLVSDAMMEWQPKMQGFASEAASLAMRLITGYGLALVGAILAASAAAFVPRGEAAASPNVGGEAVL